MIQITNLTLGKTRVSSPLHFNIYKTAFQLFEQKGYDQVNMVEISQACKIIESELYQYFGNKQDIIIYFYQCINADWQQQVELLPRGKLAERFSKATELKIELMAPYELFLGNIIGQLIHSNNISVNSFETAHIRAISLQTIQKVIDGASDAKTLKKRIKNLPALLFMMHWAALFMHLQTFDRIKTQKTVALLSKMISQINSFSFLLPLLPFVNELGEWANTIAQDADLLNVEINRAILKVIFKYRKIVDGDAACMQNTCETCYALHELDLEYFTSQKIPIQIILPAFPAKSPNQTKVLGKLPDLGEEIALQTLNNLCEEIKLVYSPGAQVTICSDGRIFSELVGVTDDEISAYVEGIKEIIRTKQLKFLSLVNLEDLLSGDSFDEVRKKVLQDYSEPYDELVERIKTNEEFKMLFNGMHRFIVEDRKVLFPEKSISSVKEESKGIAIRVIQHSNAWTRFLNYVYPKAIRVSIHPYQAHSKKIGIKITKAFDNWLTPWHGVIVLQKDGYVLMKKSEAEERGALLVLKDEQPYYYTLMEQ